MLSTFFYYLSHLDIALISMFKTFGLWTYFLLFIVIFFESGIIFTPFLPGESLLFTLGTLAARDSISLGWTFFWLSSAAILGGFFNYLVGKYTGHKILNSNYGKIKKYLKQTHTFFDHHGGKTILLARLVPIIRTYAPFVAGLGEMDFYKFSFFNISGGLLWIGFFLIISYFFGNLTIVKDHFSIVILAIIFISILPAGIEFWKNNRGSAK